MEELFWRFAGHVALAVELAAILIVAVGAIDAFVRVVGVLMRPAASHGARKEIWRRFARWLIAGLTFQLAADIIETSITTDWEAIARVAAIAVIRTFLNYFLEKDLEAAESSTERPRTDAASRERLQGTAAEPAR